MGIASLLLAATALIGVAVAQDCRSSIGGCSGSHTNIARWCGKPYESGSPDYAPGGMLQAPAPGSIPRLWVQIQPRDSIYDSSEDTAAFIVDAKISYTHGVPFTNKTSTPGSNATAPFSTLDFDIRVQSTDELLVSSSVGVGATGNVFEFAISGLESRLEPYSIVFYGSPMHQLNANQSYNATTELYYLPHKTSGSTVKIDNLHGGMLVANNVTSYTFEPLLPFGFYTGCSNYLNYSLANVTAYKDLGFNAINPVCAFTDGDLGYLYDWLDETNLWYQYDMRGSYLNLTSVAEQVPLIKDRSAFLGWYTADEPDGWQYALNSTRLAYDLLKKMDPYHPTALVLNCDNYYFDEYASGADYVMEDAYPVSINATWSRPYGVPCNDTYGDCGCDDCIGELQDVANRLDNLYDYQNWLGESEKPLWAVLQAFSDGGYWIRDPSVEETWAMIVLSFNHMAKGIMSWTFPSTDTLNEAHGKFSKVATVSPVADFLVGAEPTLLAVKGVPLLDVAYWSMDNQAMVAVANLDYASGTQTVNISIPLGLTRVASDPWGDVSWILKSEGNDSTVISTSRLDGLATSIVILE